MRKAFGLASAGIAAPIRAYLTKGALWTFALQMTASALTLLGSMMMARYGGKEKFGAYSIVFNWVNVLIIPALFGLNDLLIRELSALRARGEEARARGLVRSVLAIGALATAVTVGVFLFCTRVLGWFGLGPYLGLFDIALWAVPMLVFTHLGQAVFLGSQQMAKGQATEKLVKPAVFALMLWGVWAAGVPASEPLLAALQVLSFVPGLLWLASLLVGLYRSFPAGDERGASPYGAAYLLRGGGWFLLAAVVQVLFSRLDSLQLGYYFSNRPEQVGFYGVAARYAELLLLPFVVLNTVAPPLYAKLYAEKNPTEMQAVYTRTTRILLAVSLLAVMAAIWLGPMALRWFGKDFAEGYPAFCWLGLGQLFYAFTGTGGMLLLMTGHERLAIALQGSALALAALGQWLLIPHYGITGAAMGSVLGYAAHCALLWVFVPRYLGVRLGPWGI